MSKRILKRILVLIFINILFCFAVKVNAANERVIADGFYQLKPKTEAGGVIDIAGAQTSNGANAQTWSNSMNANQRFKFIYNSDGYYTIQAVHSKKYLQVVGTTVKQYDKKDVAEQRWIIKEAGDGYYYISSLANNKYLGIPQNNGQVEVYDYDGSDRQKIKIDELATIENKRTIEDGYYIISSGVNDNKVLDINGVSKSAGANIHIWDKNNGSNQIFKVAYNNDGTYTITSILSQKVLEVANGSLAVGANVQQGNPKKADWQKWIIKDVGNGYYSIASYNSGLMLDVANGKSSNGTNVQVIAKDNTNKQKFKFNKIETQKSEKLVENGIYQLMPRTASAGVIEIAGAQKINGANTQIWSNNMNANQKFKLIYNEEGYYTIQALHSGKYLESIGTVVQQYEGSDIETQRWIIKDAGNGYYNIISSANNSYLGIYGSKGEVAAYEYSGSDRQQIKLEELAPLEGKRTIDDGYYTIASGLDENKVLDINGVSKLAGANIHIWDRNNGSNQVFKIVYNNDGTYTMTSVLSQKVIEVTNSLNVQQGNPSNVDSQKWIIKDIGNGYYNIVSYGNSAMLDVANGKKDNGTNVQVAEKSEGNKQKFKFNKIETQKSEKVIENGYYQLGPKVANAGVIDIAGAQTGNGVNAQLWANNKTPNQRYKILYNEEGYYTIQAVHSEKYLEVVGTVVQQYEKNNIETQKWIIKEAGDGYYYVSSLANNNYLGLYGNKGEVAAIQYTGTDAQKLKLSELATLEGKQTIEDGYYTIASKLDENKVLDVINGSITAGTNMQLYTKNNRNNQKFKFTYNGDGTYTIKSLKSNKVLDIEGKQKEDGSSINQQYQDNTDSQKWIIKETTGGYYNIISYGAGAMLDVYGGKATDGAKIQLLVNTNSARQEFKLEKTNVIEGTKSINTGNYKIVVNSNRDEAIEVSGLSRKTWDNVGTWSKNNGTNQRFIIEYKENGFYRIRAAHSMQALQIVSATNNNVVQNTLFDSDEQEWVIKKNDDETYSIISACNGLYLEVQSGNVQVGVQNDSESQKFIFEDTQIDIGTQAIKDGEYRIVSCLDNSKVVDIANASLSSGATALLWTKNNVPNQNFKITYKGNGYYKIVASFSGNLLGVDGAGNTNTVNVAQYTNNDSITQEWIIKPIGDGYYNIISACNNFYLESAYQSYSNGANIQVGIKDGSAAQKFKFEAVPVTVETGTYGSSGLAVKGDSRGTSLKYYKIGNGPNVFFATFSVHGFEDSWAKDGLVLTEMAENFKNKLISMQDKDLANKWTIYIFPSVNPDGANYGTTNNGPGRTSLYSDAPSHKGIDINRNWHISGTPYQTYSSDRNYNGTAGFQAYEARYLRDFLLSHKSTTGQTILVDAHGWLNETIGDAGLASYYHGNFGITKHIATYGNGYLVNWARSSLGANGRAARSMLLELPMVNNYSEFVNSGFTNKYINSTINMLRSIG